MKYNCSVIGCVIHHIIQLLKEVAHVSDLSAKLYCSVGIFRKSTNNQMKKKITNKQTNKTNTKTKQKQNKTKQSKIKQNKTSTFISKNKSRTTRRL